MIRAKRAVRIHHVLEGQLGVVIVGGRVESARTPGCAAGVWMDGVFAPEFDLNAVDPDAVFGLEFYGGRPPLELGASNVPTCGALVVWTAASLGRHPPN
jgi:hypothetical protein